MPTAAAAVSQSFLIDQILPTRAIHLVSGPSGVGKTTLVLQMLNDWTAGRDVLGRKSFPAPFCYVSCARGRDEAAGIIERCELNLPPESFISLPSDRSLPDDISFEGTLKLARHRIQSLRLLVLDPIEPLVRGRITEYNVVADFMRKLHDACTHENLTIIGLSSYAKEVEGPRRARPLGSVAWGAFSSTMFALEGSEDEADRTLRILGMFDQETHTYELGAGGFVATTDDSAAFGALDMKLGALQPGDQFETSTALQWGKAIGARATVERWLKKRIEDGVIERIKRGTYKVKFSA